MVTRQGELTRTLPMESAEISCRRLETLHPQCLHSQHLLAHRWVTGSLIRRRIKNVGRMEGLCREG